VVDGRRGKTGKLVRVLNHRDVAVLIEGESADKNVRATRELPRREAKVRFFVWHRHLACASGTQAGSLCHTGAFRDAKRMRAGGTNLRVARTFLSALHREIFTPPTTDHRTTTRASSPFARISGTYIALPVSGSAWNEPGVSARSV